MNSDDPLFKNYMALYLSIVTDLSITKSLQAIGLFRRLEIKDEKQEKNNQKCI